MPLTERIFRKNQQALHDDHSHRGTSLQTIPAGQASNNRPSEGVRNLNNALSSVIASNQDQKVNAPNLNSNEP